MTTVAPLGCSPKAGLIPLAARQQFTRPCSPTQPIGPGPDTLPDAPRNAIECGALPGREIIAMQTTVLYALASMALVGVADFVYKTWYRIPI